MMFRVSALFAVLLALGVSCSTAQQDDDTNAGGQAGQEMAGGAGGDDATGGKASGGAPANTGGTAQGGGAGQAAGGSAGQAAGGSGGQGMGGAGTGGTPTPMDCGGLAFCNGFEGLGAGPLAGSAFSIEGGTAADYLVTSEQKHTGANAVKVASKGAETRMLKVAAVDTKTGGGKTVYARAWMYFPELPAVSRSGEQPHYRLARLFGQVKDAALVGATASAGIVGANGGRMLYIKESTKKDCAADGATLPAQKWTCVEIRADATGFDAWIDGKSMGMRGAVAGDACWQKYERVLTAAFGFQIAAATVDKDFTFYMDDIAVDSKRIGCD
ncbi:MAG: hypothetical protein SF187_24260 [Deltaproteobacteria bacterium]|nr:hypothetical protein [Deltaproteobacteria bacterium]